MLFLVQKSRQGLRCLRGKFHVDIDFFSLVELNQVAVVRAFFDNYLFLFSKRDIIKQFDDPFVHIIEQQIIQA